LERNYRRFTVKERPELMEEIDRLHSIGWPEFIGADPVTVKYWNKLKTDFPGFQFIMVEEMKGLAVRNDLEHLLVHVRPSLKARYPLTD